VINFAKDCLDAMAAHASDAWPAECCGVVVGGGTLAQTYVRIPNIAGTAEGAETSSRGQRDGYVMDPQALMKAIESAEGHGGGLLAIVHSHPEVGAYFSAEDKRAALGGGDEPLWPDLVYVVVSCRQRAVDGMRAFEWAESARDFREQAIDFGDFRDFR
jgi:proteasome lid subunit RPN8/RPN11